LAVNREQMGRGIRLNVVVTGSSVEHDFHGIGGGDSIVDDLVIHQKAVPVGRGIDPQIVDTVISQVLSEVNVEDAAIRQKRRKKRYIGGPVDPLVSDGIICLPLGVIVEEDELIVAASALQSQVTQDPVQLVILATDNEVGALTSGTDAGGYGETFDINVAGSIERGRYADIFNMAVVDGRSWKVALENERIN